MCLIAVAVDVPGPWLLVVAANRDEFHDRHAAPAAWWDSRWRILAGRDLQGGGTWLGLQVSGDGRRLRLGALTNLRPGLMPAPAAPAPALVPPSRGRLVAGFLEGGSEPLPFLEALDPPPAAYAGFNLLAAQLSRREGVDAGYLNNLPGTRPRRLAAGVHVVSNATLEVEWPKTRRLREAMRAALIGAAAGGPAPVPAGAGGDRDVDIDDDVDARALEAALLEALADCTTAPAPDLPRTGLEPARERLLSAPFIVDDHYGTRCSTVIIVGRDGSVCFTERRFGAGGHALGTIRERFRLSWSGEEGR